MSFGEMLILGVIALVVVGPRRLPSMMRSAGGLIGKVRRMAMEIRTESGIDEILDAEGIRSEIDNFRRLATGEILLDEPKRTILPDREREYPGVGCDAYGALSEDLVPYVPALPAADPTAADDAPAAVHDPGPSMAADESPPAVDDPGPSAAADESPTAVDVPGPSVGTDSGLSPTGAEVKN
jgi:sec-independent protein translocase protein TatB